MDVFHSTCIIENFMATCDDTLYEALSVVLRELKPRVECIQPLKIKSKQVCPMCKKEFCEKVNYCPRCGQKMDWNE